MMNWKRKTLCIMAAAIAAVTQNAMAHTGNQTVEITQVLDGEHMYYIVTVIDPDRIAIVRAQIRDPDGVLNWDSGAYFPDCLLTSFEFTIPEDVVIEYGGDRQHLEVMVQDCQTNPAFSKWKTPEWNPTVWEPPYWPSREVLTGVYDHYLGDIPTVSEWGLIVMGLLLLTVGTMFIRKYQTALVPVSGPMAAGLTHGPLFAGSLFLRVLAVAMTLALLGVAGVIWRLGTISNTDLVGALLCTGIVAYWVHLLILWRNGSRGERG